MDDINSILHSISKACPILKNHLINLYCAEIELELLKESGIGKSLKYLLDFAKLYESDFTELKPLIKMIESILLKWKNFVSKMLFDYQEPNEDFA